MRRKLSDSKAAWLVRLLPLFLVLGACATGTVREKILTLPIIEGATYVGMETCAGCHDEKAESLEKNVHGRLADFELMGWQGGCESCHGAGSLHVDGGGDAEKILQPADLISDESGAICTKCHTAGGLMSWTHSEHALADVSCTDCHSMHGDYDTDWYLKKSDPELCYDCHQEQQAKMNFPSHHPVEEGKMTCSSCHNPHDELRTEEQSRDLCLECHARYQGPFVFEHAPVEEDCNICHDPHGTVANNMLTQNEPFLCLQCHESHFHAARVGGTKDVKDTFSFDGARLSDLAVTNPEIYAQIVGTGTGDALTPGQANTLTDAEGLERVTVPFSNPHGEEGWRKAFLTKCSTCHSVVHGSDLPSQTVPATGSNGEGFPDGGLGLTR
ncbi:MAG: DmsE family decaheme c-type cytochrome [Desulfuromonadales bacterium]|nr:DmsE family decaheme c-type cytochrome [Desulfuromonadales bacterium]NIS43831.1 DmsE family decaheme c-type cytochrome [Desulfuromonadales bacterium]